MRWCGWCNTSFGSQEQEVIVEGKAVHERCEAPYRRDLSDKIAKSRHRLLHLPSLAAAAGDDNGYGKGKL